MGKRIAMASAAFIAVCVMGVITGNAAGVTWGNMNAGFITLYTFLFACFAFGAVLVITEKTP